MPSTFPAPSSLDLILGDFVPIENALDAGVWIRPAVKIE